MPLPSQFNLAMRIHYRYAAEEDASRVLRLRSKDTWISEADAGLLFSFCAQAEASAHEIAQKVREGLIREEEAIAKLAYAFPDLESDVLAMAMRSAILLTGSRTSPEAPR